MSKKTLYFDAYCGYTISAVSENGRVSEFLFEKNDETSITGNIYKGRIENVLPGMNAAFVNCGLERNCYLSADDSPDEGKYEGESCGARALPELHEGDEVMVQVEKPPVGKKGAKVTLSPTFVGKSIIYMPRTPFLGVSRKITDSELRKNLLFTAKKIKNKGEGLVLRTAAPYARRDYVEFELNYLKKIYSEVEAAFKTAKTGDLLFSDWKLPQRVLRDTLLYDVEKIYAGTPELKNMFRELLALIPTAADIPVILHDTGKDMFDELGISEQILSVTSPKVPLENGGNLIIEKCEALTVIDVNTGKFTGDDNLEQTVYFTNLSAAREIARQVRLRNIGGIVVVDFIDMSNHSHKKALFEELERALLSDGAKCAVAPVSKFGLAEFTRKRTGSSPLSYMLQPCKHCKSGNVKSFKCSSFMLRAKILKAYCDGARKFKLDISSDLSNEILSFKELLNDLHARAPEAEIYVVPHKSYNEEQFTVTCDFLSLPDKAIKL